MCFCPISTFLRHLSDYATIFLVLQAEQEKKDSIIPRLKRLGFSGICYKIKAFVKKYSMYLNEIGKLYEKTKKIVFIEQGKKEICLKDVEFTLKLQQSKENTPVLFGEK